MASRGGSKDLLALDARRDIYEFVRQSPGTHLRGVERELRLPFGQVLYHLDYLERKELLVVKKDGGFKRYFLRNHLSRKEKEYAAALRHRVPRRIAVLLLLHPRLSHRGILRHFTVSGSTLSFHLSKMVESGVLTRETEAGETLYRVTDADTAAHVLLAYRESFRDDAVDRFADYWETATRSGRTPGPVAPETVHAVLSA